MKQTRTFVIAGLAGALLGGCGKPAPAIVSGQTVPGAVTAINLEQGWSRDTQDRAWFTSFGSRLIPYQWLQHLEQAGSQERFVADKNMSALGFLTQAPTANNPDGFPVGFTRDKDAKGRMWAGLGCAACHTGEVDYRGTHIRIDGGQALIDFNGFEAALIESLSATVADSAKFDRFAKALNVSGGDRQTLQNEIVALTQKIDARHRMNQVQVPYGYGRLDAFGQIFNAVAVDFLSLPQNRRAPDAPVSFPVLWDAPHLDLVQWNGSAPNAGPGPLLAHGPLEPGAGRVVIPHRPADADAVTGDLVRGVDHDDALAHVIRQDAGSLAEHRRLADPRPPHDQDGLPGLDEVVDDLDRPLVPLLGVLEHRDRGLQRRVGAAFARGADGVRGEIGHPGGLPVVAAGSQVVG